MTDPADLVVIGPDGNVRAGRAAERRLAARAGRYAVVVDAPGLLIFKRPNEDAPARDAARIAMAGELLSRTSVLEILNFVANANWRGELHVFDGISHRVLAVDQAAVKYAFSDHPDDRLGEVLYRTGALEREELDALLREIGPERRLGQVLLDKGVLTQEALFGKLQKQIEQIFFSALLARRGHYVFSIPDESAEPPHHTVHLPVQGLLMEGVQRIDEMALFRERIPSDDACPVASQKVGSMSLDETSQVVLMLTDGQRSITDIARESGLGHFMTVKAIYGLIQRGGVALRAKTTIDDVAVRRLVSAVNDVLRDIFMAVATYGGMDQTRSTLEAWITGSGYAPVLGERVDEDGSLAVQHVVEAMAHADADRPMESLHQALHELAAFALFAATTTLPRDQEISLSRDVNARLKRIRI